MTSVDMTGLVLFQRLDEQDFDEKKEINRQKRLILQGKVRICEFFMLNNFNISVCICV